MRALLLEVYLADGRHYEGEGHQAALLTALTRQAAAAVSVGKY